MFHKAIDLEIKEGTRLEVTFQNGEVKSYDMADLFAKYPQLEALNDRKLFEAGKLQGQYGIVWTDELDVDVETIYEDGFLIQTSSISGANIAGVAVYEARERAGLTQRQLAELCGIRQSDLSKIERGTGNPSLKTLERIASALECKLHIKIE